MTPVPKRILTEQTPALFPTNAMYTVIALLLDSFDEAALYEIEHSSISGSTPFPRPAKSKLSRNFRTAWYTW